VSNAYLWFNGKLDDIKLYKRVLTQNDVNTLFTQTLTCKGGDVVTLANLNSFQKARYSIFPNPANSSCKISGLDASGNCLRISTITGSSLNVFDTKDNEFEIDLSSYPSGVYFLSIENSRETTVRKLIKE
jgi:hypothetical protein